MIRIPQKTAAISRATATVRTKEEEGREKQREENESLKKKSEDRQNQATRAEKRQGKKHWRNHRLRTHLQSRKAVQKSFFSFNSSSRFIATGKPKIHHQVL